MPRNSRATQGARWLALALIVAALALPVSQASAAPARTVAASESVCAPMKDVSLQCVTNGLYSRIADGKETFYSVDFFCRDSLCTSVFQLFGVPSEFDHPIVGHLKRVEHPTGKETISARLYALLTL